MSASGTALVTERKGSHAPPRLTCKSYNSAPGTAGHDTPRESGVVNELDGEGHGEPVDGGGGGGVQMMIGGGTEASTALTVVVEARASAVMTAMPRSSCAVASPSCAVAVELLRCFFCSKDTPARAQQET